jgi:hypothetical protein
MTNVMNALLVNYASGVNVPFTYQRQDSISAHAAAKLESTRQLARPDLVGADSSRLVEVLWMLMTRLGLVVLASRS